MPEPILDADFTKNKMYADETVAKLMKAMESRFKDPNTKPYILTKNQDSVNNEGETLLSVDRGPQVNTNNGNLHNNEMEEYLAGFPKEGDNAKVGAIFHVGNANVTDTGSTGGTHFITAVFDPKSKKLTIVDSRGEVDQREDDSYPTRGHEQTDADYKADVENYNITKNGTFADPYKESGEAIIAGFKAKFGDDITVYINPKEYFLKQSDSISCGVASVYVLDHLLQEKPITTNEDLGINIQLGESHFTLEDGAEKLRLYQRQQIEQYNNKDNMSKTNGSELDDEESKKSHTTTEVDPDSVDSIGASAKITALWQQREDDLKKIINTKYNTNINTTDENGTANTTPTADELIKHYKIRTDNSDEAKEVRAQIYNYNQEFGTKLAEAMSAAVNANEGKKLNFSSKKQSITIETGGRDLELPVTINAAGRKEIKILPDTLQPGDNFTMSLAFQDEHGNNMPKNGALYYQIRVDNGKITSISAPELHQDTPPDGPFHAFANGKKVYPKLDRDTLKRMQEIQTELASEDMVHNTPAPLTVQNIANLNTENAKRKGSSINNPPIPDEELLSTATTVVTGANKHNANSTTHQNKGVPTASGTGDGNPDTPPTPPRSRSNSTSSASESGKSEGSRPATAPTTSDKEAKTMITNFQTLPAVDGVTKLGYAKGRKVKETQQNLVKNGLKGLLGR